MFCVGIYGPTDKLVTMEDLKMMRENGKISNRFGQKISKETDDHIRCFHQYFHGDLSCCEEKKGNESANDGSDKKLTKPPPPKRPTLSEKELKVLKPIRNLYLNIISYIYHQKQFLFF